MLRGQHGPGHLYGVRRGEVREHHARVVGPLPKGMHIAGAVGAEAQHAAGGDAVRHEAQKGFRRLVHPVEILKDDDLRPHLSGPQQQAAQGVEDLGPAQLRVHGAHGWIARIDGEQVA